LRELFCFLLLRRNHPHPRETLASLFWAECNTPRSKKYLRQASWQLQLALSSGGGSAGSPLLVTAADSVVVNSMAAVWFDVAVFEKAFTLAQGVLGEQLDTLKAQAFRGAVQLYQGNLLEGWYQDWCLYERERLLNWTQSRSDITTKRAGGIDGEFNPSISRFLRDGKVDRQRPRLSSSG
jgi:DNA-binding SARP family transcriptional activator